MKHFLPFLFYSVGTLFAGTSVRAQVPDSGITQFVFTSDVHYGITRKQFRGAENVSSAVVNDAMVLLINHLPWIQLPNDGGLRAGQLVSAIDFVAITGDITNRAEPPYLDAASSWEQFSKAYINGLRLNNAQGKPASLFIVPGNHDVSNAIGYYKPMKPERDASSMAAIYNFIFKPSPLKTAASFNYATDKINYSRDVHGVHFMFLNIWPDSANRIWMEKDLASVNENTPVVLFAHDPPDGDPKHFTNPVGDHKIDSANRFENLLPEVLKDDITGSTVTDIKEQEGFVAFLQRHPNIKAYFHGHNNWTEFYTYTGINNNIHLPTFRADSPMKGKISATDQSALSFQVVTIDRIHKKITVRECLWNINNPISSNRIMWGKRVSIDL